MESWRTTWRRGIAPLLSYKGLLALYQALACDDPRLIQGSTCVPLPHSRSVHSWPIERADAIAFCAWQGDGKETVGEAEEVFARLCFDCDQILSEPAGCRHWINWWDEAPRQEVFDSMLPEVGLAIVLSVSPGPTTEERGLRADLLAMAKTGGHWKDYDATVGVLADWMEDRGRIEETSLLRSVLTRRLAAI